MYGYLSFGSHGFGVLSKRELWDDDGIQVMIGGADRTSYVDLGSMRIVDRLNGRSTCEFRMVDRAFALLPQEGEPIFVHFNGARVFGGSIERVKRSLPGDLDNQARFHVITCVDWCELADRHEISYIWENVTLRELLEELVFVQTRLGEEGVTLGRIADAPVLARVSWQRRKLSDAFRDIAALTGTDWIIDSYRLLHFMDKATNVAPWTIGDGQSSTYAALSVESNRSQYRNRQILRAGYDRTDWRVERFDGSDGGTLPEDRARTWNTAYPIAEIDYLKRNSVKQTLGIRGIDVDGNEDISPFPRFFWAYNVNEISQNALMDETVNPSLGPSEVLEIRYKGLYPIQVDIENRDEVDARKAVEGGTGQYLSIEEDSAVDGLEFAEQKTNRLLEQFGHRLIKLDYKTMRFGLMAGMLQTNAFSNLGVTSTQFLIQQVTIRFPTDKTVDISVQAIGGESDQDWTEFFRAMASAGRTFAISRKDERIIIGRNILDQFTFDDVLTDSVNGSVTLGNPTDDPFTVIWFGIVTNGTELIPAGLVSRARMGIPYGV